MIGRRIKARRRAMGSIVSAVRWGSSAPIAKALNSRGEPKRLEMNGIGTGDYIAVGDDAAAPMTVNDAIHSDTAKTVSAIALTYHGYRRTGSIVWALAYGLAGHLVPVVAVPVAVAQGFGKRRVCTTE